MWTENVFNLLEKHINTKKGTSSPSKCHLEKCIIVIPVSDLIFDRDLGETNRQNDLVSCVVLCHCQCVRLCVHNVLQQTRLLHLEHLTGWMGWDLLGSFFLFNSPWVLLCHRHTDAVGACFLYLNFTFYSTAYNLSRGF